MVIPRSDADGGGKTCSVLLDRNGYMVIPRSDADGGRRTCSVLLDRNEYTQK